MEDERTQLAAEVARLESITEQLGDQTLGPDTLAALAEAAMSASARVNELLPRVIRAIELASEGASPTPPQT